MHRLHPLLASCVISLLIPLALEAAPFRQIQSGISVINRSDAVVTQITDGDLVKLRVTLPSTAPQSTVVTFQLDPDNVPIGECTVALNRNTCETEPAASLGWHWTREGKALTDRAISAIYAGSPSLASTRILVSARPVVLVHGFGSSADAWKNYTGATGYLASIGVKGFAVGDGQVPGRLNLGDLAHPTARTETIGANAEILSSYIGAVKEATGAEMVDLVAHSMGNLVSRYYIDRVMRGRDVAQMIMLGPPNAGTDCAYLPSALGYYLPSALEIRPSYVQNIFNLQITHRHGIPFTIIAGTPILEPVQSPCTAVPSDLAIALASARAIDAPVTQMDVWHTDLNTSERVFSDQIRPLLQKTAGEFVSQPDSAPLAQAGPQLQFTRVFTGHVDSGSSATVTINVDSVTLADFALFDPTRSLTVTVRGASGNIVVLDPARNGLVRVQDPATLVYLGYGFTNPKPGPWQVTLLSTPATPSGGADYAVTAQFQGGALLKTSASAFLPAPNTSVDLDVQMELAGQPLPIQEVQAQARDPRGGTSSLSFAVRGDGWGATWVPEQPGLYAIDISARAAAPDGAAIERSSFVSIDVQPTSEQTLRTRLTLVLGIVVVLIIIGGMALRRLQKVRNTA